MECNKPGVLIMEGNLHENFKIFKQQIQIFFKATKTDEESNGVQVARLLNLMGTDALKVYNTLEVKTKTVETILNALEKFCSPVKNEVMAHFKFFTRLQHENEQFDKFYSELKMLVKGCDFGICEDKLLRTQIVLGVKNRDLQSKLLREDLSLEKVIMYCKSIEQAELNTKLVQERQKSDDIVDVDVIANKNGNDGLNFNKNFIKSKENSNFKFNCRNCGFLHGINKCPAYGKTCFSCGGKNHFSNKCRQKCQPIQPTEEITTNEEILSNLQVGSIVSNNCWYEDILINKHELRVKVDTGAQINVISRKICENLKIPIIIQSRSPIHAFGGFKITPLGIIKVTLENNVGITLNSEFLVVENNCEPILGLFDSRRFKFQIPQINSIKIPLTKEKFLSENKDLFVGLGKFPGTVSLKLRSNAVPKANPARRMNHLIKSKLLEYLQNFEKIGIIEKVNECCEWVSNLVVVEKKDKTLRLCIDPRDLNKYLLRDFYPIPTLDEIIPRVAHHKFYTVLDLKDGFFHVCLDKESTNLCSFSTPYGVYKYLRMPQGLCSSPEYFQKIVESIFGHIEGVVVYFDDIIVCADSKEKHDNILNQVIQIAKKNCVKFNPNKIQFCVPEVKYMGLIFNEKGVTISRDRLQGITDLKPPTNRKELQSIMGMINYLRSFIPNLSEIIEPWRLLLKKDVIFDWNKNCENSFVIIKEILCKLPTLHAFDKQNEIEIQCDASQSAIGACLFQNKKPVYFSSRSLTESESNYAQIEKELLSITDACTKKFHEIIYGRKITVYTDHLPLISLMDKEIHKIPNNRLRRMKLKLVPYDITVRYLPGSQMYIADLLSRNFIKRPQIDDECMKDVVHTNMLNEITFTGDKLTQFQNETQNDNVLNKILNFYQVGWPVKLKDEGEIRHYFKLRNNIYVENKLIFYDNKLIVPRSLRNHMLNLLHETHFGIVKTKLYARKFCYWPGMNNDVENFVNSCYTCQRYSNNNCKEKLITHDIPDIPFYKVGVDIGELNGNDYLILIDYFSKWLEVVKLGSKTSTTIINKLKEIFSRFGIPKFLVADNMPFGSAEFKQFSKDWDFDIINSSPHYHQSNGMAEKAVGIVKNMLRKCSYSKMDFNLFLLNYRNTPLSNYEASPAQLLQSRNLKTKLPIDNNELKPKVVNIRNLINKNQDKQRNYYNLRTKNRPEFVAGEAVLIRNLKTGIWEKGKILNKLSAPRTYLVQCDNSKKFVRNSFFIKKCVGVQNL